MWMWITIGAGLTLGLSALVGLALGALFATIGREIGELFETELWKTAPASRAKAPSGRLNELLR
jgi:hypothetical protein